MSYPRHRQGEICFGTDHKQYSGNHKELFPKSRWRQSQVDFDERGGFRPVVYFLNPDEK